VERSRSVLLRSRTKRTLSDISSSSLSGRCWWPGALSGAYLLLRFDGKGSDSTGAVTPARHCLQLQWFYRSVLFHPRKHFLDLTRVIYPSAGHQFQWTQTQMWITEYDVIGPSIKGELWGVLINQLPQEQTHPSTQVMELIQNFEVGSDGMEVDEINLSRTRCTRFRLVRTLQRIITLRLVWLDIDWLIIFLIVFTMPSMWIYYVYL
jgi:hypothetical protein